MSPLSKKQKYLCITKNAVHQNVIKKICMSRESPGGPVVNTPLNGVWCVQFLVEELRNQKCFPFQVKKGNVFKKKKRNLFSLDKVPIVYFYRNSSKFSQPSGIPMISKLSTCLCSTKMAPNEKQNYFHSFSRDKYLSPALPASCCVGQSYREGPGPWSIIWVILWAVIKQRQH